MRACRIITEKENDSTFVLIFIMSIKVPKNVLIFTGLGLRLIKCAQNDIVMHMQEFGLRIYYKLIK